MSDRKIRIFDPNKNRFVKVNEFGKVAKNLYRIYINELQTPMENVLPEGLKYNPETDRFTKTSEQKIKEKYNKVEKITYSNTFNNELAQNRIPSIVKNILSKYKGKSIKVISFNNGDVLQEGILNIPENYTSWWKNSNFFRSYIMIDSVINIFSKENNLLDPFADEGETGYDVLKNPKNQGTLIIDTLKIVKGELYKQKFLDGVNHCFFTPIKEWANNCLDESKSKTAQKRYKGYIKKINEYIDIYHEGIPEDNIQEVCDKLQISVDIDLPSLFNKKVKLLSFESHKKPLKKFKFINTRINHIEINDVKYINNYEEVNEVEMNEIKNNLDDNDTFYFYKSNKGGVSRIYTFDKIYKLEDDYSKIVDEFSKQNNLEDYKIDHLKNRKLSEFCLKSVKTNGTIDFVKNIHKHKLDEVNHIDMKRAYTKNKDCSYYRGILGKITDFRFTNKIMGLGLYEIRDVKINNPLFEKLNFIHNYNIYTSAELEYFKDNGVEFKISGGCWGSRIDIDFGPGEDDDTGMYGRVGEDGPRIYCKWFGCLTICETMNKFKFNTSHKNYLEIFKHQIDNDYYGNIYYEEPTPWSDECGIIEYRKRKVYHQSHIASFITSYQRISILEQLKKIDMKNLLRVCVDGIYFKGNPVELNKNFNYKDKKTFNNEPGNEYCVNNYDYESYEYSPKHRENNQYEFHKGPGGTGKTHTNLIDNGLIDVLFVAPSWKLARRKQLDYNVNSTTFYHILTDDPDVWRKNYRDYSVIIIDEVSMLSDINKNRIIGRFKHHKLIFCGDVNYQLDPVYSPYELEHNLVGNFKPEFYEYYFIDKKGNEIVNFKGNENTLLDNSDLLKRKVKIPTIEHNTMHRCKCPILKENLLMLRKIIESRKIDRIKPEELLNLINNKLTDKDNIDYKIDDYIITNTHQKKDIYTEKYKDIKKYYVKQNYRDYCNGEIILHEKPKNCNCEIRHGFTIHSLQGETALHNLFIDIRGITSLKMLYTAISRVQYWKQITFIQ